MNELIIKNMEYYRNFILTKNDELKNIIVESPAYGMKLQPNYVLLLDELNSIEENILNINVLNNLSIVNDA